PDNSLPYTPEWRTWPAHSPAPARDSFGLTYRPVPTDLRYLRPVPQPSLIFSSHFLACWDTWQSVPHRAMKHNSVEYALNLVVIRIAIYRIRVLPEPDCRRQAW